MQKQKNVFNLEDETDRTREFLTRINSGSEFVGQRIGGDSIEIFDPTRGYLLLRDTMVYGPDNTIAKRVKSVIEIYEKLGRCSLRTGYYVCRNSPEYAQNFPNSKNLNAAWMNSVSIHLETICGIDREKYTFGTPDGVAYLPHHKEFSDRKRLVSLSEELVNTILCDDDFKYVQSLMTNEKMSNTLELIHDKDDFLKMINMAIVTRGGRYNRAILKLIHRFAPTVPTLLFSDGDAYGALRGETIIETTSGHKEMKDVEIGDTLKTWDHREQKFVETTVTDIKSKLIDEDDLITIYFERDYGDTVFLCGTRDHPVFSIEDGWVHLEDLEIGDEILDARMATQNGVAPGSARVCKIVKCVVKARNCESVRVYDIECRPYHHYFTEGGLLTHNCDLRQAPIRGSKHSRHATPTLTSEFAINAGLFPSVAQELKLPKDVDAKLVSNNARALKMVEHLERSGEDPRDIKALREDFQAELDGLHANFTSIRGRPIGTQLYIIELMRLLGIKCKPECKNPKTEFKDAVLKYIKDNVETELDRQIFATIRKYLSEEKQKLTEQILKTIDLSESGEISEQEILDYVDHYYETHMTQPTYNLRGLAKETVDFKIEAVADLESIREAIRQLKIQIKKRIGFKKPKTHKKRDYFDLVIKKIGGKMKDALRIRKALTRRLFTKE